MFALSATIGNARCSRRGCCHCREHGAGTDRSVRTRLRAGEGRAGTDWIAAGSMPRCVDEVAHRRPGSGRRAAADHQRLRRPARRYNPRQRSHAHGLPFEADDLEHHLLKAAAAPRGTGAWRPHRHGRGHRSAGGAPMSNATSVSGRRCRTRHFDERLATSESERASNRLAPQAIGVAVRHVGHEDGEQPRLRGAGDLLRTTCSSKEPVPQQQAGPFGHRRIQMDPGSARPGVGSAANPSDRRRHALCVSRPPAYVDR